MKSYLKIFISLVILTSFPYSCKQKNSVPPEDSFLGEWYTIKGDLDAYSFLKDDKSYIFVGTQGMRPVVYGTWEIDKNMFVISMDNGTTTEYSFRLSNDTLIFNDGLEIYTRTTPIETKYPEVIILSELAAELIELNFTTPVVSDINWGIWVDSSKTIKEISIKGWAISAGSTLSSGILKQISDFIKDHGFEPDSIVSSEICSGYWDNNQVVTVCTSHNPESSDDSVYIRVSSGFVVN